MLKLNTHDISLPSKAGLRTALPWVMLLVSIACTLSAWHFLREDTAAQSQSAFQIRAQRIAESIVDRLNTFKQILGGGVALFAVQGTLDRLVWREYVNALDLEHSFPEILAMGYAPRISERDRANTENAVRAEGIAEFSITPLGDRPLLTPILFIEPFNPFNRKALGFDMYSEAIRRAAMLRAHESGAASMTSRVDLVQNADQPRHGAGLLLYLPVYQRDKPLTRSTQRELALRGYVYAAFHAKDFFSTAIAPYYAAIDVEIFDGEHPSSSSLLFDRDSQLRTLQASRTESFRKLIPLQVHGRTWSVSAIANPDFAKEFDSAKSFYLLAGGGLISALMFLVGWFSASAQRRTRELAEEMTQAHKFSNAKLHGIIQTARDAIITIDESQSIVLFNAAAERIFGLTSDQVVGTPLDRLLPARYRNRHRAHVRHFGSTGETMRAMGADLPLSGLRANGEEFPLDASISQLTEGEHALYTVILRDITRRKQAEDALKQAQDRLAESSRLSREILSSANERLRQLSNHIEVARESERTRIAREVHDDLAATLTGIKMDLSVAKTMTTQDPVNAEKRLDASLKLIDGAVQTTRRIINDLRPSILDNLGVWAAIDWQARETAKRAGLQCEVEMGEDVESTNLSSANATALFRVVQESLNNVWRHAGASRVSVRASRDNGVIQVQITDDGRGFDEAQLQTAGHWGVMGMYERVRSHGGKLEFTTAPGHGTQVRVSLPIGA